MDHLYAELNENNVCIGISQLAGEVEQPNMIPLTESEFTPELLGKKYNDGIWEEIEIEVD